MSEILTMGISPCPNDTFIFDAWVNGKLAEAPPVHCRLEDISTLNDLAQRGALDVVKVSFYAYGMVQDQYTLLNAGGALGRGCGPLIVARPGFSRERLADPQVNVAVPGRLTTANLLLSLYQPAIQRKVFARFEQIMPAVVGGAADAGVIIHEGRFTYKGCGLVMVEDLGAWWEQTTGHPTPLCGIIARKTLGPEKIALVESAVRRSLQAALARPEGPMGFMQAHAQEMDPEVMRRHVELYVNRHSLDYGTDGMEAIRHLLEYADRRGLFTNACAG